MKLGNYLIVSKRDVIEETYKRPDCKYARECDKYLTRKKLTPVYVDGNFPYLNVYANFIFYSGCLPKKEVRISEKEETLGLIKKNITRRLGLKTKIIPKTGNRGAMLILTEGGPYVSRLLEVMGLPRSCGPKAKLKLLEIPGYRTDLFTLATCEKLLEEGDKEMVRKLERDSTAVLFSARASLDTDIPEKQWVLNFFARPTREKARDFARKNLEMVNFSAPEIGLKENRIKTRSLVSGSYSSYIPINGKELECILDANRDLLKFSPKLKELYGFDLDFEPLEM